MPFRPFPLERPRRPYPQVPRDFDREGQKWAENLMRTLNAENGVDRGGFGFGVSMTQPGAYPYNVTSSDLVILVDTSAARTINLPAESQRLHFVIKDFKGAGAGTNNITVTPATGQKIDGAATFVLTLNKQSISVVGTGVSGNEWVVI